jgi:hypothetical protein
MHTRKEKPFTKIGLVEWLKVNALSSNPSTANKKQNKTSWAPLVYNCNPNTHEAEIRGLWFEASLGDIVLETLF